MEEYEVLIRAYLEERGWDNLRPGDVAKSISIESAELLELFQWSNPTLEEVKQDTKKLEEIKKELADVFNYCFDMSVLLGFDTKQILKDKLDKVKEKYPAHLMKNRGQSEPGVDNLYLEIKKKHRAEQAKK